MALSRRSFLTSALSGAALAAVAPTLRLEHAMAHSEAAQLMHSGILNTYEDIVADYTAFYSWETDPMLGNISLNSYLLKGAEPVLIDCGRVPQVDLYLDHLRGVIDLADIKWIWLSHEDPDHTGALQTLLTEAPDAKVLTNMIGLVRLMESVAIPFDRVHMMRPGDVLPLSDRSLRCMRPPLFDSPGTIGFFDDKTQVLFSSDCFGGFLPVQCASSADVDPLAIDTGCLAATAYFATWGPMLDPDKFGATLDEVSDLQPVAVLSSHLPAFVGDVESLINAYRNVPSIEIPYGPGQDEFVAMLQAMAPPPQ